MRRTNPKLLSNVELLSAVVNRELEPVPQVVHADTDEFISALRLVPGRKRVALSFLWAIYRQWSYSPTRKSTFAKELRARFKRSRSRYEVFYWLSHSGR